MDDVVTSTDTQVVSVISVILVNYAAPEETIRCLKSLKSLAYPENTSLQIVVVDNASPDQSVEMLQRYLSENVSDEKVQLIASSVNGGFSAGNNLGIQWALETYKDKLSHVWLLNNDTEPEPTALNELLNVVQQQAALKNDVLVGSLLRYPDGQFQQGGIRINHWTGQLRGYPESSHLTPRQVDAVSGASLLIPRCVLDLVGRLEESHFLYVEDVDYCLKAKSVGVKTWLCPNSVVIHDEGASTGKEGKRASALTQYYYQRNRMVVLAQYGHPLQWVTFHGYTLFRWLRMGVKALFNPSRREEWRVLTRALCDYGRGKRFASF